MATTDATIYSHLTPAGDPNGSRFAVPLPAAAWAAIVDDQAAKGRAAADEIAAILRIDAIDCLDVDRLFALQGAAQDLSLVVDVMLKGRPASEWATDNDQPKEA